MSDPDVDHAREAMATLDHGVCRHFPYEPASISPTVVLPATVAREVGTVTNGPPWCQLGPRQSTAGRCAPYFYRLALGHSWGSTGSLSSARVFDESCGRDSIAVITWRPGDESCRLVSCVTKATGDPVVFIENFPRRSPAKFVPAD